MGVYLNPGNDNFKMVCRSGRIQYTAGKLRTFCTGPCG